MADKINGALRVRDFPPVQNDMVDDIVARETPAGAQAKADAARDAAKAYTDAEVQAAVKAGAVKPRTDVNGGHWDIGTAYDTLDLVFHASNSWYASEDTVAGEEPGVSPKWVNYAEGLNKATADAAYVGRGELLVNVLDHGAMADFDGTTGTDNLAAFNAAYAALAPGGRFFVPPGRYWFSGDFTIDKTIDFDTPAGGLPGNLGTQLVFAAGSSGVQVLDGSGWRVGPFNILSQSTVAGSDVGLLIRAPRGVVDRPVVEDFGSHGIHLLAGSGVGGGNCNLTVLIRPRAVGNRGDGIRGEGTDAQNVLCLKPDTVANYGWGINLLTTAAWKIVAPHADQAYNGSPGAYRDAGNSNDWDWVYSESGIRFLIDTGSSGGRLSMNQYAPPALESTGNAWLTWRIDRPAGMPILNFRGMNAGDTKQYRLHAGSLGSNSLDLINQTDGQRLWSIDGSSTRQQHYLNQRPNADNALDLGSNTLAWREVFVHQQRFKTSTLPAAASSLRGQVRWVEGAAGVADVLYVCRKNAADAYEWAALT